MSGNQAAPAAGGASTRDALSLRVDRTSLWLRASGVVAVLAAASTFMLQRWEDGRSDDLRYLYLLTHGVMLFGSALFCGAKMKESRAARTFLLLTLGTMPACFAVLGGLVLSRFSWEASVQLPKYALWQAHSDTSALACVGLTLGLSWGLTRLAARALARHSAPRVAWTFVASQCLLLLPVRDPSLVGPIALIGMLGALLLESQWHRRSEMRTFEGRLVRGLYWLSPLLVLGRSVSFYGIDLLTVGSLNVAIGAVTFVVGIRSTRPGLRDMFETGGAVVAAVGAALMGVQIKANLWPEVPFHLLSALPLAAMLLAFGHLAGPGKRFLQVASGVVAAFICVGAVFVNGGILASVSALVVGVACAALGLLADRRLLLGTGALSSLVGLVATVEASVGLSSLFNWGSLTLLGVGSLLTAALVERHRGRIVLSLERSHKKDAARRVLSEHADVHAA